MRAVAVRMVTDSDGWRMFAEMRGMLQGGANPCVNVDAASGECDVLRKFLTLLAVCHTVIPEVRDGKTFYQASSPDESPR